MNLSLGSDAAMCFDFLNYAIDGKLDKPEPGNFKYTEHQRKELNNWYVCNSGGTIKGELDSDGSGLEKSGPGGSGPQTFGLGRARA